MQYDADKFLKARFTDRRNSARKIIPEFIPGRPEASLSGDATPFMGAPSNQLGRQFTDAGAPFVGR